MTKSNFYSFFKTLILASFIIIIGYNLLAYAGANIIVNDESAYPFSPDKENAYVFYSSNPQDIVLYPWNYYETAKNAIEFYPSISSKENDFSDFVDIYNLYDNIRYYFYKILSTEKVEYLYNTSSSLWKIIDFDRICYSSKYSPEIEIYFYKSQIMIDNKGYTMEFSYNSDGELFSFLCDENTKETTLSNDIIDAGSNNISELLNTYPKYIDIVINDIIYHEDILYDYQTKNAKQYIESIDDEYFYEYPDIQDNSTSNTNALSYQLIALDNEILLLMHDYGVVLHYNPLNYTFTGFNYMQ